jgi:dienelactone hydrolase
MRAAVLTALLTVAQVPVAGQPVDPAELGTTILTRLNAGDFAAVVATFDQKVREALPEDKLRFTWGSVVAQAGAFKSHEAPRVTTKGDFRLVVITCEFERARADLQVVVNAAGQVAGLSVRPSAPSAPFVDAPYVDSTKFTERDVTVDAGGWPLPGTLTVPNGAGPWPAVVLVHGSGPSDRDETIGPNKVFRDLAHGLASRGIAVLRYEKRTRVHGARIRPLLTFTVKEETVDDAVAAVALLGKTAGIDPKRVFVAGHSLGGMVAPRIAVAAGAGVRGLVILAGAVRSLEQSIYDQSRYLSLLDGTISPDEQRQLDAYAQMAARIKTLAATDAPVEVGPIAAPASYFVDLRGYDPPAAAARLAVPMLILQGGRDYQVTMDDFAKWKAALGSRPNASFADFPAANHLFIAGAGPSTPAEYMAAGHVAAEVIEAIAAWVARQQ